MVRTRGDLQNDAELNKAAWEAAKGAGVGAAYWGLFSGILGAAAYIYSPVYRGLTVQFKVFLQMSGMAMGGFIEAERRMQAYEQHMRRQYRIRRDAEVWRRYEQDYAAVDNGGGTDGDEETPGARVARARVEARRRLGVDVDNDNGKEDASP